MGVIIALNQAVFLKRFWLKRFKEPKLELVMLIIFIIGFIMMIVPGLFFFVIGLVGVTFGQSILRTVMNSQIASKADPKVKGEVLGITASITNLSLTVGPLLAGYLFSLNINFPFLGAALFLTIAFFILYTNNKSHKQDSMMEVGTLSEA